MAWSLGKHGDSSLEQLGHNRIACLISGEGVTHSTLRDWAKVVAGWMSQIGYARRRHDHAADEAEGLPSQNVDNSASPSSPLNINLNRESTKAGASGDCVADALTYWWGLKIHRASGCCCVAPISTFKDALSLSLLEIKMPPIRGRNNQ